MRLNSNIYRNLFPEEMMDFKEIEKQIENVPNSYNEIWQVNHNFMVNDILYKGSDGIYGKAIADNTEKSNVTGMVTHVSSNNKFTLMDVGIYPYMKLPYKDSTILYLHDRIPGFMCHYLDLRDKTYIPVGIYVDGKVLLNIQNGISGIELQPYDAVSTFFETYSREELNGVVEVILNET